MNASEFARALYAAKHEIDEAIQECQRAVREDAEADDEARRAMSRAYLTTREQLGGKATVSAIEAAVDLETSDLQRKARLAEGLKKSAFAALDAKKQWLSALQSQASLEKAEAQLARWEGAEGAA